MNLFCKLVDSRFINDSDNFVFIVINIFIIITFDDVEQDIMISDVCCKYSIEEIIINADIIC